MRAGAALAMALCVALVAACGGGGDVTYEPKVGDTFDVPAGLETGRAGVLTIGGTRWTFMGRNTVKSMTKLSDGLLYTPPAWYHEIYLDGAGHYAIYDANTGNLIQEVWVGQHSITGQDLYTVYNLQYGWSWFSYTPPIAPGTTGFGYWGTGSNPAGGIMLMDSDIADFIKNGATAPNPALQWEFGSPPGPGTVLPCVCGQEQPSAPWRERDILATIPFNAGRGEASK